MIGNIPLFLSHFNFRTNSQECFEFLSITKCNIISNSQQCKYADRLAKECQSCNKTRGFDLECWLFIHPFSTTEWRESSVTGITRLRKICLFQYAHCNFLYYSQLVQLIVIRFLKKPWELQIHEENQNQKVEFEILKFKEKF